MAHEHRRAVKGNYPQPFIWRQVLSTASGSQDDLETPKTHVVEKQESKWMEPDI
jgi:hypothetical protein